MCGSPHIHTHERARAHTLVTTVYRTKEHPNANQFQRQHTAANLTQQKALWDSNIRVYNLSKFSHPHSPKGIKYNHFHTTWSSKARQLQLLICYSAEEIKICSNAPRKVGCVGFTERRLVSLKCCVQILPQHDTHSYYTVYKNIIYGL
jgi:hypothetical protein